MAIKDASQFLIVNGVQFPVPKYGLNIIHSQTVDAGRNAKGAVVGQLVGRKMWKINDLEWDGLDAETWKAMKKALDPFFVKVTFTDDSNVRRTITMYPGDVNSKPLFMKGLSYEQFESCKFNLIDAGWDD